MILVTGGAGNVDRAFLLPVSEGPDGFLEWAGPGVDRRGGAGTRPAPSTAVTLSVAIGRYGVSSAPVGRGSEHRDPAPANGNGEN
jgi:hypothetical protein